MKISKNKIQNSEKHQNIKTQNLVFDFCLPAIAPAKTGSLNFKRGV